MNKNAGVISKKLFFDKKIISASKRDSPKLKYHNFKHELYVVRACEFLAKSEKLAPDQILLLKIAALLHDVVLINGQKDNEEKSAKYASELLNDLGYDKKQIFEVKRLILATKMPTNPKTIEEMIICDADTKNLGTDDLIKVSKNLSEELNLKFDTAWIKHTILFLEEHKYYTRTAQKLWSAKKSENIKLLKQMLKQKETTRQKKQ